MSMSPFSFSVVVYHGHNKDTGESNYHRQQGMGFADSFAQAASIIENFYGNGCVLMRLERIQQRKAKDKMSHVSCVARI